MKVDLILVRLERNLAVKGLKIPLQCNGNAAKQTYTKPGSPIPLRAEKPYISLHFKSIHDDSVHS